MSEEASHQSSESHEISEMISEIDKWAKLLPEHPQLIELAFFKIFVKFEKFLLNMILKYSTGNKSSKNYCPKRRLEFLDEDHVINTISPDKKFLEINEKTKTLVKQLFHEDNPFTDFFDSEDTQFYNQMKLVRNYIAHESEESKVRYQNRVLSCSGFREFIEPLDFLNAPKNNRKGEDSNYTEFVNIIIKTSDYILIVETPE